ncbi:Ferric uptake regulation protein FUR [plant metagenome]
MPSMSDQADLKNMGLKATFPRLKILDIFRKSEERHLSAEDVYRALIGESVEIGLATVYRVLTQFEQAGILSRSQFDSGKAVFELNDGDHHDHLICTHCGTVVEFSDPDIEKRQHKIAKDNGFVLESHHMVLYGTCGDCVKR